MKNQAVEISLLDTPHPWQLKLVSHLDSDSKLRLFKTCRQLNEIIMQHSQRTTLELDPVSRPVETNLRALQTASRHAPSLTLALVQDSETDKWWRAAGDTQLQHMGQVSIDFLQAAHKQGATAALTSLHLEHATLDVALPPSIGQACPNLTSLGLHCCRIKEDRDLLTSGGFQQLQSLQLSNVIYTYVLDMEQLQAQLQGLTALKSLTITSTSDMCDEPVVDASFVSSVAGQLTHLHLAQDRDYWEYMDVVQTRMGATLQHLQLGETQVCDSHMDMLLNMPSLTHVEAQFRLRTSLAGKPCKWLELRSFGIDLPTLAFLPLHSHLLVKVMRTRYQGYDKELEFPERSVNEAVKNAQQALINVQKAKGLQWGNDRLELSMMYFPMKLDGVEFAEVLAHTLPLLTGVRELEFEDEQVYDGHLPRQLTGKAVQALCTFVRNHTNAVSLDLKRSCFEPEHADSLVRALPCGSTMRFCVGRLRTEQVITQLCCAAQCKITLHVQCKEPLLEGYMERIKSAMQSCGHQHVILFVKTANSHY